MFKNQPRGLYVLALANTGERFGYYTMLATFLLFLQAKFGLDSTVSGQIYAAFLALVYFMPLVGGWVADKWSFSKCVVTGIFVMFFGYAIMSIPTPIHSGTSLAILCAALLLIAVGTGLFKGNLQVMVGDLYNEAKYSGMRDAAFSLFYMAINIGSMFAPMAATGMCNMAMHEENMEYTANMATMSNWYIETNGFTDMAAAGKSTVEDMEKFAKSVNKELYGKDTVPANTPQFLDNYYKEYLAPQSVMLTDAEKAYMGPTNKLMKATRNFTVMPTDEKYINRINKVVEEFNLDKADPLAAIIELRKPATDRINAVLAAQTPVDYATKYITTLSNGYSRGFAVACVSLIISFLIYFLGRKTYAHIITDKKAGNKGSNAAVAAGPELTPAQTKQRVVALMLVFAVVIFFWMVFHQNGATLTEFAKTCTSDEAGGWTRIGFNVWALASIAVGVYALFNLFQSKTAKGKCISGVILAMVAAALYYFYTSTPDPIDGIQPQEYQQFNPFYVVALTPVSLAFFGWLASRKKEPSAPRKIGYGMLVAAVAYVVMIVGSMSLTGTNGDVSPNWLISTYLLLTFAELLLSPMGISFVSKVAPPKLKGSMMGGWFAATAVGNYLVSIPMLLWGKIPTWLVWAILVGLCLLSAAFLFSQMKKLEAATSDTPADTPVDETLADPAE